MSVEIAMTITVADIERLFSGRSRHVDGAEEALSKALNLIRNGGELDSALASKIVKIAESADLKKTEWIAPIICALTEVYSYAQTIINQLVKSQQVVGRLSAIYALSPKLSDEFLATVLNPLVADHKSIKVRMAAVDWIGRHNKKSLSSILVATLSSERNENVRKLVVDELALLEFGYLVERKTDPPYITVVGPHGRITTVLQSDNIERLSDSEIFRLFAKPGLA